MMAPNASCVELIAGKIRPHFLGNRARDYLFSGESGPGVVARHRRLDRSGFGLSPGRGASSSPSPRPCGIAEFRDLRLRQELGVVHRVARDGAAPSP